MPGRDNRFTIYDALEKSGYFDANPANSYARSPTDGSTLYKGPEPYPRMLYHPQGEERVTVPGEILNTPLGAKLVGEQRELLWQIVNNKAEDDAAQAEGWHTHPAKAIRARIERLISDGQLTVDALKSIPVMSSDSRIKDLEAEIERLTGARAQEQAQRDVDLNKSPTLSKPVKTVANSVS